MKRIYAIALAVACALALCMPTLALGDAGGFSGSSSYGGGSSSGGYSGGSSSYGGSSGGTYYYGGGSSSSSDESGFGDIVIAIVVVGAIIMITIMRSKIKSGAVGPNAGQPAGAAITPQSKLRNFDELRAIDPDFSEASVSDKVANVYVKMQNAWTDGDMEPVRPYFEDALFAQFARQLSQLKAQGRTNYVNNIAVLEATARGWYASNDNEYIVLKVRTRINDYTVDASGNCVVGDPDRELFMEYEYTLVRPAGTKTGVATGDIDFHRCPNCGATLDEGASAKCPYCDSVITINQHDWVISSIKGVSQQTA